MIINLELKLNGELPVTREELLELVSSWGRTDTFYTIDSIRLEQSKPKECYPLDNLDA